jgi:hypothetical protein
MRICITGPNKFKWYDRINSSSKAIIAEIAKIVAKSEHEIVLTPDKESALAFFGREYLKNGGKKIWEIVPLDDKEWGYEKYLDTSLGEIINCGTWESQPAAFNRNSDLMICLAYGGMVMAEIGCTTYYNPKKIYVIKELITAELPKELNETFDIEYISYKALEKILKNVKKK